MTYTPLEMLDDEPGGQLKDVGRSAVNAKPSSNVEHLTGVAQNSISSDERFPSAGRGPWSNVPDAEWNDWRWQLRNRITTLEQLEALMPLTPEERAGVVLAGTH